MGQFLKKYRWVWITLLVILTIGGIGMYMKNQTPRGAEQFQTADIKKGKLTATIGATGTVRSKQTAVLSWQTSGTVDTVNVKVGDNVPADFVMAFLTRESLAQNIILAEAELATAEKALEDLINSDTSRAQAAIVLRDAQAAYDKAVQNRDSLNGLIDLEKIITKTKKTPFGTFEINETKKYKGYADEETKTKSDEKLALAKAKLEDAQRNFERLTEGNSAEILAAQARVNAAKATINLARIISPFGGIVTESYPMAGDIVNPGTPAFRIDDMSNLFVDVEVSEVDINSVEVGQPVLISFDAILGSEFHGEVVEVAQTGTVTGGTVNFKVTVVLTDADSQVKPGMTAAVNITVDEIVDVLLVPNRAVRLSDGERVIYILKDGKSVKTVVRLGQSSDTMSVLIAGDVADGDVVILNPPVEFGGPGGGPPGGGFGN